MRSIFSLLCSFSSGESDSHTKIASGCSANPVGSSGGTSDEPQSTLSMSDAIMIVLPLPVGAWSERICGAPVRR